MELTQWLIIGAGVVAGLLLTPFVAYLWGRSQASGWIQAFKNSNLTFNKKDNGKTKEE